MTAAIFTSAKHLCCDNISLQWIFHIYACQKIKSGKLFPFSSLNRPKNFFPDFSRLENDQTFFHTFRDSVATMAQTTHFATIWVAESAHRKKRKKNQRTRYSIAKLPE